MLEAVTNDHQSLNQARHLYYSLIYRPGIPRSGRLVKTLAGVSEQIFVATVSRVMVVETTINRLLI
jgi:hypothetical protein